MLFATCYYLHSNELAVWVSAVNSEQNYVREESTKPHGPYLADAYADVDEEEEGDGDF